MLVCFAGYRFVFKLYVIVADEVALVDKIVLLSASVTVFGEFVLARIVGSLYWSV